MNSNYGFSIFKYGRKLRQEAEKSQVESEGRRRKASRRIRVTEADIHPHLRARMHQRGITREEIERTLNEGWAAADAKPGTLGKVMVFPYGREWEGQYYEEKEVRVYYRLTPEGVVLLTAIARYGKGFSKEEEK